MECPLCQENLSSNPKSTYHDGTGDVYDYWWCTHCKEMIETVYDMTYGESIKDAKINSIY